MPQAARFQHANATLRAEPLSDAHGPIRLIWLHGWGQSRESLRPLAESLLNFGEAWLLDLPGHGEAPNPPRAYSPADYAELVHAWLATQPPCPTIVLGHSFGFRVAVHMASQRTNHLNALVAIAGAGVPRILNASQQVRKRYVTFLMATARRLKPVLGEGLLNTLRHRFGSNDYLNATPALRPTFVAVVNDDVSHLCPAVTQPVLLVYAENDTATPPSVGQRFKALLPDAALHILPHHNHHSVLAGGRHVVANLITSFIKQTVGI